MLSFEPDLLLISSSATVEGGKYEQYSKLLQPMLLKMVPMYMGRTVARHWQSIE